VIPFAARALWARKLRTALTAVAIVLGVSMVSGTYVLTDSIDQAFDNIFTDVRRGSNVVITGKAAFDVSTDQGFTAPPFEEDLLPRIRALDVVEEAAGGVNGEAQIIGEDGKALVYGGAPNLGFSIDTEAARFNPLTLLEGDWPGPNEVVIDRATAQKEGIEVGATVGIQSAGPVERLRVSGLVAFGSVATIGGATLAGFDLPTAQRLFDKEGKLDEIAVAAPRNVSDDELVAEIERVLPSTAQVRTAEEQAASDAEGTDEFITFLQGFLLAFGGIALFVGAFVIANSLSITIAQRTREFATLRTLGGSRRQVLRSIVLEALIVGVVASVIGLFLGLALARLLFWLFDLAGFTLPNTGLLFLPRTIFVALAVGIVVTLVASLRPAFRATRVPPIAAVREGASLPESRLARFRTPGAVLLAALGFAAILYGLFADGLSTTRLLVALGVGTVLVFLGVALFAARIVQPLAEAVAPLATGTVTAASVVFFPVLLAYWLLRHALLESRGGVRLRVASFVAGLVLSLLLPILLPIVLLMALFHRLGWVELEWPVERPGVVPDRVSRGLARGNAKRDPNRTASTAAALMIGLALVTLVAVLGAGIRSTFNNAVDRLTRGEFYAVTAQNNFSPIPIAAAEAAAEAPGVESIASVRAGEAQVFGSTEFLTAVTPNIGEVMRLDWDQGSPAVFAQLGRSGAIVDDGFADRHDLRIGSRVPVLTPAGRTLNLVVRGVFDPPPGGSPFGAVTMSSATFDANYENQRNLYSFAKMRGGVSDANQQALERTLADFPNAKVADGEQFKENQASGLSSILNILYVLLALSIIVSLFGIVNTLVLTVFERTRELGMLRAIGMTRRQVKRMIRQESVVTALIGAALGIALGLVFGALLVARVEFIEFALPVGSLIVFAIAAIVVGIVAAVFPARRASRLNVLEALQYE
jgi:ABC-type antimicrobial peptide transport system permease subunit